MCVSVWSRVTSVSAEQTFDKVKVFDTEARRKSWKKKNSFSTSMQCEYFCGEDRGYTPFCEEGGGSCGEPPSHTL